MENRQFPVGVIQICWMAPGPSISAMVNVSPGLIVTNGFTFHPCPRSRAGTEAFAVLRGALGSGVAIPPFPFSPVKFSGLIERVSASESLYRFPMFISSPLNDRFWATDPSTNAVISNVDRNVFNRMINVVRIKLYRYHKNN